MVDLSFHPFSFSKDNEEKAMMKKFLLRAIVVIFCLFFSLFSCTASIINLRWIQTKEE